MKSQLREIFSTGSGIHQRLSYSKVIGFPLLLLLMGLFSWVTVHLARTPVAGALVAVFSWWVVALIGLVAATFGPSVFRDWFAAWSVKGTVTGELKADAASVITALKEFGPRTQ